MKPSALKYTAVFSPHSRTVNKIHVPPKVLVLPVFHPPKWQRVSVREGGSASNPQDSQDSDSESLPEEGQDQLGLQQRILENEGLLGLGSEELDSDSLEEDSLEEVSSEEETSPKGTQKNGRKSQSVDKYSSLKYNPNWKNTRKAGKASQVGGSSVDFSQESFYLHSSGSSEEKSQEEANPENSFLEFGSEFLSFPEPNVLVSNEPLGLQTKKKESGDGFQSKDRPQRAKKNFVKKNKQTLGLPSERINSYLELHKKKQQGLQEQVTDPKTVDEEEPPPQTVKKKPEDNLKGQQLKDQHNKFSQREKTKPTGNLDGKDFPRNGSQQPPGRAAEPKPWHHNSRQTPGFQAAPSAEEQDKGTALQECLHPNPAAGPDADPAAKSNTGFNNSPNSRHFVNQGFPTPTWPVHPTSQHCSPADTSKENKKYLQDSPRGIPHSPHHIPGQHFASTSGQANPKQRNISNISSAFNASFQELKDQIPLQDCKKHIHEDKSSAPAPCATSGFSQLLEQQLPGIPGLAGAPFAHRWLLSLLPPALPRVPSGSQGDPEAGNPLARSRSNSEGHLTQMKKQTQPKGSKKPCGPKVCINLNVKLGGLGPDYEAIKEKKQKLKLQKEYSRQIKEYNMKNITLVQKLPAKPQVTSSVSRQKALEYAKRIPRPKTFMTRPSDKEVKEEVLSQTSEGSSFPKIPSLETLRSRHEKEKEVVAAFKALHIL
ncbi:jhy protein homolog [Pipra filicauda]|uniref:Jhy protein homolog n=1 Tax=Pipra filicauda TaxID=649802 RepID=A0A6J2GN78_9PASS|nr:jhy protein homolog [Pipra filicauda]XP_039235926.1 jhy protein homolog [Pipra filicauda]XP_039235927.1 jhy protein homolog [Pipra filicauda]